jgi:uncharacterized protein YndB with AHSA1/START domain
MARISKQVKIKVSVEEAFKIFVDELNEWWPKEYTWSQDSLERILIDGRKNGLCTEIGPYGFRCDWGRVTEFIENKTIGLKWQISPNRQPVPNPKKASELTVNFVQDSNSTKLKFEHFNFENHGEGAGDYRSMMDSEQGWEYILDSYKKYCEKN